MNALDPETIIYRLRDEWKARFNTIAAAINTQKNDGLAMAMLPTNDKAFAMLSLNANDFVNYDPFLFIYIDDITTAVRGPVAVMNVKVDVCLFVAKTAKIGEERLGLRYMKAMQETALALWDRVYRGIDLDLETLLPVEIKLENSTKYHRVYGVSLSFSL